MGLSSGVVMGNSFVPFEVSMGISREEFNSGKTGYSQKIASLCSAARERPIKAIPGHGYCLG